MFQTLPAFLAICNYSIITSRFCWYSFQKARLSWNYRTIAAIEVPWMQTSREIMVQYDIRRQTVPWFDCAFILFLSGKKQKSINISWEWYNYQATSMIQWNTKLNYLKFSALRGRTPCVLNYTDFHMQICLWSCWLGM